MNTLIKSFTQLYEMSKRDLKTRFQRQSGVYGSGWKYIPSVSAFKIDLSDLNVILEEIGFERRLGNRLTFIPNENKSMNRYMGYSMRRISKLRTKDGARKFWFLSWIWMKRSISFRVSALNKVFPSWYKNMPLAYIININKKVNKIMHNSIDDLEFKRAYIPKDEDLWLDCGENKERYAAEGGKWRPLGVPLAAWRVVLHMWCNFLTFFLMDVISPNQHAYRPKKGTLTAWKSLVSKLNKYPYIYEIDLKGCFDNIQSEYVSHDLENLGMPPRYKYYLENLNRCTPRFKENDLIDESKLRDKAMWPKLKQMDVAGPPSMMDAFNNMEPENQAVVLEMAREEGMHIEEFIQLQWALWDQLATSPATLGTAHLGLPQGANTSPILTALVIDKFTRQYDSVFYADDGIFFSMTPIKVVDDPDRGIYLNKEKSKLVRDNWEWKSNLKFLGLLYDPWTNRLSGHTRKGSRLEFTPQAENIHSILKQIKPKGWSQGESKWERLFKSTLGGFVMSKLYNATWQELEYMVKFVPYGVKGSWLELKDKLDNYRTTSSTACRALSYIIKSGNGIARPKGEKKYTPLETKTKKRVLYVKGAGGKKRYITLNPKAEVVRSELKP